MKRIIITLVFGLFCLLCCSAQNAFSIHSGLNSPVCIYYDTNPSCSHVICKLYPHEEFKWMSRSDLREWKSDGFPICGAFVTIGPKEENDMLFVELGFVSGYSKKGCFAVTTKTSNNEPLILYDDHDYESVKIVVAHSDRYAVIYGVEEDWFYVRVADEEGKLHCGWLPPESQCPSFLTTCP